MKKLQLLIALAFCFAIKLQAQTITTGTLSTTTLCVGASINVPYTITGTFMPWNVFTAQLSDNTGSFTSPVAIGTRVNATAGTILAVVPSATAQGSAYRIRVVSSAPVTTGVMNTTNILVNALPTTPTITAGVATGGSVVLTSSTGTTYLWSNGATTQAITASASGSYTVRVTNASGCQSAASAATGLTSISTLPPLHFSPQTTIPTWNQASKVITADVNNDGKQDFVVQNIGYGGVYNPRNDRVSVFLGNGNGTFQTIINTATGPYTNWLGSGDFNADGRIDFVTPNYVGESISILLGRGDGTFNRSDQSNGAGTMAPSFVISGDVNGDGRIDILTTNEFSSNVSVFLGNGSISGLGTFQNPTMSYTSAGPRSIVMGDFNSDGKQDIVVYTTDPTGMGVSINTLFLGNGTGSFYSNSTIGIYGPLTVGDFNSDGVPDIAGIETNVVKVLLGNGNATFRAPQTFSAPNVSDISSADLNGDGFLDLQLPQFYNNTIAVLIGNGDGSFNAPATFAVGTNPRTVASADFNSDGKPDLVVANYNSNNVSLLLNTNTAPTLTTISTLTGATEDIPYTVTYTALAAAANEFDADGDFIFFRIESVSSGILTKNGIAVVAGTTVLYTTESLVWTPAANVNGTVSAFTVKAYDGSLFSSTAIQVMTNIDAVNDAPVANAQTIAPTENTTYTGTLTGSDIEGNALTYAVVSQGSKGVVTITNATTGAFTYVPNANANGSDSFTFKVNDGSLDSAPATVTVNITACTPNTGDTTAAACVSFVWYGTTYTSSATPTHTFTNVGGCDSVVTLHLTISTTIPSTPIVSVVNNCNGTSTLSTTALGTLLWNTAAITSLITVSSAATYTVTQTVNGCVSAAGSGVAVPKTSNSGDTTATACGSFVWYSNTYTSSATPTHTFTNVSGCDSVVTLHLTINTTPTTPTVNVANNCNGTSTLSTTASGTLLWSTNETTLTITVSAANTYTVTQTVNACVSAAGSGVAAPKTSNTGDTTVTACGSFVWYSITYTTSATPTHTFTNVSGCDSVVTLHLTINTTPATPIVSVVNNCNGTSTLSTTATGTLLWSNAATTSPITVSSAGTYTVTTTVNGCVSAAGSGVVATNTTPATPTVNVVNNCNGTSTLSTTATGTLLWSTAATTSPITVSSAGTYTVTTTVNGCLSASGSGVAAPNTTPATATVNVLNICNGTSTLSTTASGTLLWSTGATTSTIDVSIAGAYTVTQTVNGCVSAASATFNLAPAASTNVGIDWTTRTSAADNVWNGIVFGNGLFVAVASTGVGNRVMTSPDGINWTARTSAADYNWLNVTYGNGLFVAVSTSGTGNRVMTSPDGITWTSRTTPADNNWFSVTYGNGIFVAVAVTGVGNRVMTSPDGINWTIRTSASDNNWRKVTYGNGLFVAVAASGTGNRVMTSPDGITWTSRTSAADNGWYSVAYGNGLFVAVAASGVGNRLMTSPDGTTWTARTSAADNQWFSVFYGNGLFVAVSNTGVGNRVMTSPDGTIWTARTSASDNSWSAVNYGNGLFAAVATSGTGTRVMTSGSPTAAVAPVISSATLGSSTTVNFTQSSSASATAITNYEYSTNDGNTWTALSPAATVSPLTITGLAAGTSSIMIRAVNSINVSCASNKYILCTPNSSIETISACNSYIWHGTTYTASNNIATWTGTSAAGCDSVVTLNLTITPQPSMPTLACYETATLNTTTCSWDVTGTIPTTPSLACYQTASFNTTTCAWDITGSQAAAIVTTTSVCSSYTWPTNGQLYTQSGTYNYNSNCQDYTLNLTVANVSISSLTPSSSIVGSTVVISGSGFTGATGVSFNGTSATSFTVNSNSQITATVPTGATTGTISVTVNGVCTIVSSTPFTVNASTITLNLNVFVEGFYLGNGLMQSVLFDQNIVTDSTACDYITIELRESLNPSNPVVSSTTTILHIDGTAQITLPSTINGGDYYIVIKNRNSTETWSKVPVTFTSVTTFDFTH